MINRIILCDDNEIELVRLIREGLKNIVDLVYIDPPFFSGKNYYTKDRKLAFCDTWRQGLDSFLSMMRRRLELLKELLAPTGSIYVHLDWHAVHYVKVLMDEVFGYENFVNEVVWKRTTAHSSAQRYAPVHDTLLVYGQSNAIIWNEPRGEYEQEYLDKYYRFDDGDGRLYWRADLCAAGTRQGSSGSPWRGIDPSKKGMHWKFKTDRLDELDQQGRIYWPARGTMPQYKRYRDELKGKAIADLWDDVDRINPVGNERLGFQTQKPLALLERVISASSPKNGLVLDCFMGSGTTCEAAERLGRRWIGIDNSKIAVRIAEKRMHDLNGVFSVEPFVVEDHRRRNSDV